MPGRLIPASHYTGGNGAATCLSIPMRSPLENTTLSNRRLSSSFVCCCVRAYIERVMSNEQVPVRCKRHIHKPTLPRDSMTSMACMLCNTVNCRLQVQAYCVRALRSYCGQARAQCIFDQRDGQSHGRFRKDTQCCCSNGQLDATLEDIDSELHHRMFSSLSHFLDNRRP